MLLVVVVGWLERMPLLAWYYVRGLARAEESERGPWVSRVAGLGRGAVPKLVDCLRQSESRACANADAALAEMINGWAADDPGRMDLAERLTAEFSRLSKAGQLSALELDTVLLKTSQVDGMAAAVTALLAHATRQTAPEVHLRAMALASDLQQSRTPEGLQVFRELIRTCLRSEASATRIEAIRLAAQPGIDLLEPVVALLADPVPEVRRAAFLAVGASPAVSTDDLLLSLHDADEVVERLCLEALRGRGLPEEHIQLGRLMTDRRPGTRLQVLDLLRRANDLEPGAWLRRLSHDDSPAVRAAAVRAASEQAATNLSDRLEQMSQNDPSPTVRQLAQFYLSSQQPNQR
jgi:hypothetical protein